MNTNPKRMLAVVRYAPAHGGPDVLEADEVMGRFGLSRDAANQVLRRATQRGLLRRVRVGAYQRAERAR